MSGISREGLIIAHVLWLTPRVHCHAEGRYGNLEIETLVGCEAIRKYAKSTTTPQGPMEGKFHAVELQQQVVHITIDRLLNKH